MADLKINVEVVGGQATVKEVNDVSASLRSLQSQYSGTMKEVAKAAAASRELEGELNNLNKAFKSGAISEAAFNKESKNISSALSSARQAMQSYQQKAVSLGATLSQNTNESSKYGKEVNKLEGYHKSFNSGIRSTNTLAVEFGRFISDAPYGIQGVANNIQQLGTNYGYYADAMRKAAVLEGRSISNFGIMKGALSSLVSPIGLLNIGIAAVTAGWVMYDKWSQKANKQTKDLDVSTKSYAETLKGLAGASASGLVNAQKDLTNLKLMYDATQNLTIPMKERKRVSQQLIDQYPEQFKGMTTEAVLAGQASEAYDKLSRSITATAMAAAYANKMTDNAQKQLNNYLQILDKQNEANKISAKIEREKATQLKFGALGGGGGVGGSSAAAANVGARYEQQRTELLKEINNLGAENSKITSENSLLQQNYNSQIANGASATGNLGKGLKDASGSARQLTDYVSMLKDLQQKGEYSSTLAGIDEGLPKKLETIKQKYAELQESIDKTESKGLSNVKGRANSEVQIRSQALAARNSLAESLALELKETEIKYAQETEDAIAEILGRAGVSRITSRERDLGANKVYYDNLQRDARNNAEKLEAIEVARRSAEFEINKKWDTKAYEGVSKLYKKIADIENKPFAKSLKDQALTDEISKRAAAIEALYKEIARVLGTLGVIDVNKIQGGLMGSLDTVTASGNEARDDNEKELEHKQQERIGRILERGLRQGISGLFNDIDKLGSNFYEVFSNVFNKLASPLQGAFQNVLSQQLSSIIKTKIDSDDFSAFGFKGDKAKLAAAGVGMAGGLISSMTKKTSAGGQILGGAASGAAAGSVFGPAGIAIGGFLGGLSGFFSSKAAKKEQKIQEEILAEQRKQTVLQERATALGYLASITGQMTNQGIVTSADRNEFGDIVFRVQGRELLGVLETEQEAQKRGL